MRSFSEWAIKIRLSQRVFVSLGFDLNADPVIYFKDLDMSYTINKMHKATLSRLQGPTLWRYKRQIQSFLKKGKGDRNTKTIGERLASIPLDSLFPSGPLVDLDPLSVDCLRLVTLIGLENIKAADIDFLRLKWLSVYDGTIREMHRRLDDNEKTSLALDSMRVFRGLVFILRVGALLKKRYPEMYQDYDLWADVPPRGVSPLKPGFWKWNNVEYIN